MQSNPPSVTTLNAIIEQYSTRHQNPLNRTLQYVATPLLVLGIFGLVWSIPFPQLVFLGRYNGFVNWASFLIAFSVFYYYKLSPVISYGILLAIFAFSATIVSLEKINFNGTPALPSVSLLLLIAGLTLQFIGTKAEGQTTKSTHHFKDLLNGPLWLMHLLFKKAGIIR